MKNHLILQKQITIKRQTYRRFLEFKTRELSSTQKEAGGEGALQPRGLVHSPSHLVLLLRWRDLVLTRWRRHRSTLTQGRYLPASAAKWGGSSRRVSRNRRRSRRLDLAEDRAA